MPCGNLILNSTKDTMHSKPQFETGNGDIDGLATATNGCEKLVLK